MESGEYFRQGRCDQMPWQTFDGLLHRQGKEMTDFHFKADVMTKPGSNGGIFFHTQYQDKGWPVGHEAQINQTQKDPVKTGSVYIVKKNLEAPAKDNEWFHYEIIVKG